MQTSVINQPVNAFAGMEGDAGGDVISRVIATLQLDQVTVAGNTNGVFKLVIDGTEEANTTAATNTIAQITAALLADLENSTSALSAEASGTDKILIESKDQFDTDGFTTVATAVGSASDMTVTTLVAHGQTVGGGIGVCTDNRAAVSGQQCRLPRQSTDITANFLGITVADTSQAGDTSAIYGQHAAVSIKHKGRIWVKVESAVAENGAVYCRYTDASTNYGLGSFRHDADTSDAAVVPSAKFRTSAAAGGLALVELS